MIRYVNDRSHGRVSNDANVQQGVMGGVNASPRYVQEVDIGLPDGTVTHVTKQGGIVSIVCH